MFLGVIYDLDGTLMDSQLDFGLMRQEMKLPAGQPILETMRAMKGAERERCVEILGRHELLGAERAAPFPGVAETLLEVRRRGLPQAIVTRNSRRMVDRMLDKLPNVFSSVVTRDDGPVKPDPWALQKVCQSWKLAPAQTVMVGDFHFDITAGRRAGTRTILITTDAESGADIPDPADWILRSLAPEDGFLRLLENSSPPSAGQL